jgi:hypothetical protein
MSLFQSISKREKKDKNPGNGLDVVHKSRRNNENARPHMQKQKEKTR